MSVNIFEILVSNLEGDSSKIMSSFDTVEI